MGTRVDPRGNLHSTMIRSLSLAPRSPRYANRYDNTRSSINTLQKTKKKQCHDWIFSCSSNVHVAVDRAAFKKYHAFDTFVLTLSDQRRVAVKGVGIVELKIRCKSGARGDRAITLENVLHVPDWFCNIFSDVYFQNIPSFDFTWDDHGFNFTIIERGRMKPWGFTENFCGLDKLVLARRHDGRSPMLEDSDREVFAINLTWPDYQRLRWEDYLTNHNGTGRKVAIGGRANRRATYQDVATSKSTHDPKFGSKARLTGLDGTQKISGTKSEKRLSGLRASVSTMSLYQAALSIASRSTA